MKLSVVIPCFNEHDALPQTVACLQELLGSLIRQGKIESDSNIWLVDDGSTDDTWSLIEGLARASDRFVGLKLSRNRGHQNALLAGLLSADGDAVVSIDADLQDDPAAIERMVDAHRAGFEIVYGVRAARRTDSWFKRFTALRYYGLLRLLGVEIVPNHADFRLLGRTAIDALRLHGESNLFLRGIIPQLGFAATSVHYDRRERVAGQSKYPLRKMLRLGVSGITSFSALPLRLIAALGGVVFLGSLVMSIWVLGVRLLTDRALPGWASTTLPIYALGGLQLLCTGVLGEYIARIYEEAKRRPRFLIEQLARRSLLEPLELRGVQPVSNRSHQRQPDWRTPLAAGVQAADTSPASIALARRSDR